MSGFPPMFAPTIILTLEALDGDNSKLAAQQSHQQASNYVGALHDLIQQAPRNTALLGGCALALAVTVDMQSDLDGWHTRDAEERRLLETARQAMLDLALHLARRSTGEAKERFRTLEESLSQSRKESPPCPSPDTST